MGLSVRDDPPKVIDLSLYMFGEAREGLALAIRQISRADPDALSTVSVVIRNVSDQPKSFVTPGWLAFYRLDVRLPDGTPVAPTPYARALSNPARQQESLRASLAPGAFNETEIPLGSLFNMRPRAAYIVRASCKPLDGVTVESNEILTA